MFRDHAAKKNCGARKYKQRDGVTKPPGQAVLDDVTNVRASRGNAGHRRDMVGLERVLHSKKKAETQNSEHSPDDLM
jgi:hypothetical protein